MTNSTPKKKQIYEVAARLFSEKGFAGTSVRDLATAVGLLPSSLYSHIRSKDQLLEEICMGCARDFIVSLDHILEESNQPKIILSKLIELHINMALDNKASITVFNEEWRHLAAPQLEIFRALRKEYENKVTDVINNGIKSGEIKSLDPRIVLNTILSSTRWVYNIEEKGHYSRKKLIADITLILTRGLYLDQHI